MNKKTTLALIYNHRYDTNVDRLEVFYSGRFDHIVHLVPFYDGGKENVFSIYENSLRFQGYVAQAKKCLLDTGSEYIVFAGDDLILNPKLTSQTFLNLLHIPDGYSLIQYRLLHEVEGRWAHTLDAVLFENNGAGAEGLRYLPEAEAAVSLFERHGFSLGRELSSRLIYPSPSLRYLAEHPKRALRYLLNTKLKLSYPLVFGYSDFFVVPRETLERFAHYCGIFAAMNLFVEIAIPSALLMSTDKVVNKLPEELSDGALWTPEEVDDFGSEYSYSLGRLLTGFPENKAYIHPVKLSKWMDV